MAAAQDMLQPGAPAPLFDLPRDGGGRVNLRDLAGKHVVLYFYPRDDTTGCTLEALDFTARQGDFAAAGAVVLGLSRDSVKDHDRFCAKHGLGIPLLSDEDGSVCIAYGVWQEKKLYGRAHMGIVRSTVLIGPDGRVIRVWRGVRVEGHAEAVLQALRALSPGPA